MAARLELHDEDAPVLIPGSFQQTTDPQDVIGRRLDEAQEEDNSWRESYVTRIRANVAKLNRMKGQTGIAAAGIAAIFLVGACAIGFQLDLARSATFYRLIGGTLGACGLGIAGILLWSWLQDHLVQNHRSLGIEIDPEAQAAKAASAPASVTIGDFLDCHECGRSIPVQAPTCRCCGAVTRPVRPQIQSARPHWLDRSLRTQDFASAYALLTKGPMKVIFLVLVVIMGIVAVLGRMP